MAETPTTGNRQPMTDAARERQRAGQHNGLLHAAQKRKADNSANYATNFKHGQTAFDFERSAEAAGETRDEVRGHFSLLDRALLTLCGYFARIGKALPELKDLPELPLHTDAASPRAPKLVRALALLLWRPLRLFRMQESWERLAICYRLQQVIRWREQHGELTVERVEKFHWDLRAILENYDWHIEPRLKRIEKRFWKVWRLYRALVGVAASLFDTRDGKGSGAGNQGPGMGDPETRDPGPESRIANTENRTPNPECPIASPPSQITNPETRASGPELRPLVQFRGKPHYHQFHPTWADRIDDLSPEPIGDPFQSPSHSLNAQQKLSEPVAIKDPKEWQEHPPKPRLPEMEFPEPPADEFVRTPSERELRRLARRGELTVPGSFEDFAELVEAALGTRGLVFGVRDSGADSGGLGLGSDQPRIANAKSQIADHRGRISNLEASISNSRCPNSEVDSPIPPAECQGPNLIPPIRTPEPNTENRTPKLPPCIRGTPSECQTGNPEPRIPSPENQTPNPESGPPAPDPCLHGLAEALWNRMNAFRPRVAELRELLEATLVWQPHRFLQLWLKLLDVQYAYDAVDFFQRAHGPDRLDIAWGDDEITPPWRWGKRRPAERPRSEAEGRRVHAGELQHALRNWFAAVWHALVPGLRGTHKVTVALYEWAVSRFGIREEFLQWRPELSLAQLETRRDRPEWAVRVATVTGKTLVKLSDGRIFEPDE